jgi:drug/metabolite transporter (DMT)-like permease
VSAPVQRRIDALAIGVVVLLCVLWGLQQVAIKQAIAGGLPPVLQAALRSAFAGLLVAGWIWTRQGPDKLLEMVRSGGPRWPGLALALIFAVEFLVFYPGLQLTTAARGVLFFYTAPFFTAIFAHWFIPGERLRARQVLGLLVAFAGVALAFASGLFAPGGSLIGDAMCCFAGVLWGLNTAMIKAHPKLRAATSAQSQLYLLGGSAPFMLLAAWFAGDLGHMPVATHLAWAALAYQVVVVAFASYLAWYWLLTRYPVTQIAGYTFLTPLFGILAGTVLLGEPVSAALFAGLGAIALGMRLLRK